MKREYAFERVARQAWCPASRETVIPLDAEIEASEITETLVRNLKILEP